MQELRVIGVVGDTRTFQFDAQRPTYYSRQPDWFRYMLVRNDPGAAVRLRDLIRTLEPAATPDIQPLGVELWRQIEGPTMIAAAGSLVSVLALLIASVGTLGIFSYIVNERTREIGVRLALGARTRDIVRTIVANVWWPLAGGLLAGLLGAQALGGILGHRLYGISPRDPLAYAAVLGILIVSAIVAAWIPTRRALRVDPAVTLRPE